MLRRPRRSVPVRCCRPAWQHRRRGAHYQNPQGRSHCPRDGPCRHVSFCASLARFESWYNDLRPHSSLADATPDEVFHQRRPVSRRRRFEPKSGQGRLCGAMGASPSQDWSSTRSRGHLIPRHAALGAGRDPAGKLSDVATAHSPAGAMPAWGPKGASSGALPRFGHFRSLQSKTKGVLGELI